MSRTERWQHIKEFGKELAAEYIHDNVPLAGAAIAFYLMLSLIPLLLLVITALTYFVQVTLIEAMLDALTRSLGPGIGAALREQVLKIVSAIIENRGLLTGLTLIFGLWIGSQVFVIIEDEMNRVWDTVERRPFWKRRGLAILMVFVTGIMILLAIALNYFVRAIGHITVPVLGQLEELPWFLSVLLGFVLPVFLSWLVFVILYRFMPAQQIRLRSVFIGAAVAAVAWTIALQVFSWYTANFSNYSFLYGTLGGLVLLLLWFNYSSQIMLMGAEIAAIIHHRSKDL